MMALAFLLAAAYRRDRPADVRERFPWLLAAALAGALVLFAAEVLGG